MSRDLLTLGVWVSGVLVGGAGLGALEGEELVRGAAGPLGLNTDIRYSYIQHTLGVRTWSA